MNDAQLIEQYIDQDTDRYPSGLADARLRDSGVPVWAIVGYARVVGNDVTRVANDYAISCVEVEAAFAYYRHHGHLIDARLLLNTA